MKKAILVLGLALLLLIVVISGCVQEQPAGEVQAVKVGAILPLSGPVAIFGEWAKQGMDLAMADLNNSKISLSFEDSKSDAKEGMSAFQKLVDVDGSKIAISAMSNVSVPLIPISEERGVPLFLQDVTYPNITKGGPLLLRHFIQSDREASLLADYAINELGVGTAGVLYVNDEAGVGAKDAFKKVFEGRGSQVLAMEAYSAKDADMKTQIIKIKETGADAIYLFGNGPSWAKALTEIKELGFEGKILTNTAMFIKNFREAAGNSTEGVYFTYPYTDLSSESAQKFLAKYKEKFGQDPEIEAYYGWDLVHVIVKALEKNDWKTENLKAVIVRMKEFDGAFGKTIITEDGDFLTKVGVGVIENGEMKELSVKE